MNRTTALGMLSLLAWAVAACEEQPTLPPELRKKAHAAPDQAHSAILTGPEAITVFGLVLECTGGTDAKSWESISLMSRGGGRHASMALVATRLMDETGHPDPKRFRVLASTVPGAASGMGIRTAQARYEPSAATITLDGVEGEEVHGKIEGTFYRHGRRGDLRPTQPEPLSGTFAARLVRR